MLAYEIQRRNDQSSVKNGRAAEEALKELKRRAQTLLVFKHLVSVAVYMTVSLSLLITFL